MTQPEALRLADALDYGVYDAQMARVMDKAAAELRRLAAVEAERDALKQTLHDELAGNLRMRDLGGARPDEPMLTFLERIIAERDALLEALKLAVRQNEHDMVMTGEECRQCRAAIKAVEEQK